MGMSVFAPCANLFRVCILISRLTTLSLYTWQVDTWIFIRFCVLVALFFVWHISCGCDVSIFWSMWCWVLIIVRLMGYRCRVCLFILRLSKCFILCEVVSEFVGRNKISRSLMFVWKWNVRYFHILFFFLSTAVICFHILYMIKYNW